MSKSLLSVSGFTFELFSGRLVSAPSMPYLAHLEYLERYLTSIDEHIKASKIRHLLNVSTGYGLHSFIWSDGFYSNSCEVY